MGCVSAKDGNPGNHRFEGPIQRKQDNKQVESKLTSKLRMKFEIDGVNMKFGKANTVLVLFEKHGRSELMLGSTEVSSKSNAKWNEVITVDFNFEK